MSTNMGVAPTCLIASTVLIHVYGTVITSSPGPTFNASSDNWRAEVQELTATQSWASVYFLNAVSNSFTAGPCMKLLDLKVFANALEGDFNFCS